MPEKAITRVYGSDKYFIDSFRVDQKPEGIELENNSNIVEYMVVAEPRCAVKD